MLRAISGPLQGATFEVGDRVLIGRIPACDILIADNEVSREHAMIVTDGVRPTLLDLGSRNGTFVKGKRVERHRLRSGDAFAISGSEFVFDQAAPISTRPVLAAHFGGSRPGAPSTEEIAAAAASADRETLRSMVAAESRKADNGGVSRPTVRLEAAATDSSDDKATVKMKAVNTTVSVDAEEFSLRRTAELEAVPAPEADADPPQLDPPSFVPPPVPRGPEKTLDYVAAEPRFAEGGAKAVRAVGYGGEDLPFDITNYRSFRLRLQRGEIPTGEEVANMIDLEAALREPSADADPRRDVIAQRFFRRFEFVAPIEARFTVGGETISIRGQVRDLSVDGVRAALDFGNFSPGRDQLAVLLIDSARDGKPVRYTSTARVVWSKGNGAGFVFAGVPSWSECSPSFHENETAVRQRSKS